MNVCLWLGVYKVDGSSLQRFFPSLSTLMSFVYFLSNPKPLDVVQTTYTIQFRLQKPVTFSNIPFLKFRDVFGWNLWSFPLGLVLCMRIYIYQFCSCSKYFNYELEQKQWEIPFNNFRKWHHQSKYELVMIEINGKLYNIFHLHIYLLYVHGWQWVHSTFNAEAEKKKKVKSNTMFFESIAFSHESWNSGKIANKMQWVSFVLLLLLLLLSRIVQNPHITPSTQLVDTFPFRSIQVSIYGTMCDDDKVDRIKRELGDIMNFFERSIVDLFCSNENGTMTWHFGLMKWHEMISILNCKRNGGVWRQKWQIAIFEARLIKSTEIRTLSFIVWLQLACDFDGSM